MTFVKISLLILKSDMMLILCLMWLYDNAFGEINKHERLKEKADK